MISNKSFVKRRNNLLKAESDGEYILLDPKTNLVYSLNETARAIWKFTRTKRSVKDISDHISKNYDVKNKKQLTNDILAFINTHNSILFELTEFPVSNKI